jgi:hypothetical protein
MKLTVGLIRNFIRKYVLVESFQEELKKLPCQDDLDQSDPSWWKNYFKQANELLNKGIKEAEDNNMLVRDYHNASRIFPSVYDHYKMNDKKLLNLALNVQKKAKQMLDAMGEKEDVEYDQNTVNWDDSSDDSDESYDEYEQDLSHYMTRWDLDQKNPDWWKKIFQDALSTVNKLSNVDETIDAWSGIHDDLNDYITAADAFMSLVHDFYDMHDDELLAMALEVSDACSELLTKLDDLEQVHDLSTKAALASGDPEILLARDELKDAKAAMKGNIKDKYKTLDQAIAPDSEIVNLKNAQTLFDRAVKAWKKRQTKSGKKNMN